MPCIPFKSADGKVTGIVCTRGRRRVKCATCKQNGAQLECDGCDKPLCAGCAVSPRNGLDFCPACTLPVWKRWWAEHPEAKPMTQASRRIAFRAWALAEPATFLRLVPMGRASAGGKPTPLELWKQADGDAVRYLALLEEHGHLRRK